ncbi:MAG: glucose-6-phosphate dehydrogenase [Actinomycetota bacterium]|nr:glucose-6-phosphate dehydrogenase [Actinomycetota bacterium]
MTRLPRLSSLSSASPTALRTGPGQDERTPPVSRSSHERSSVLRPVRQRCDALVLFGATGDLAKRKLFPALQELARDGRLPDRVVGVASSDWSDDKLRARAREAIEKYAPLGLDEDPFRRLEDALTYVQGDYRKVDTFDRLRKALNGARQPLLYLAIPPSLFETVVQGLEDVGLHEHGRVVLEKPFGRDLQSSRHLNDCLLRIFSEEAVFRVDHFLGKEEVLDLLVFRFANTFLAPAWNRNYIDNVQITMSEDVGVEGRGRFYEEVGALRDVVQNHLLEVVTLVAMEPPVAADAQSLRDEKVKILRSMPPLDPAEVVRGQYLGYRDEAGVEPDSQVETFVALKARIDSWRWADVPFYIRAGKRLATTATEVLVEFKQPPRLFFARSDAQLPHPNHLVFRMKPGERVSLSVQIKRPGEELVSRPVDLAYTYDEAREGIRTDAYARLLDDALKGDQRLFARADGVEEAWRVIQPVLDDPPPPYPYEPRSWGPPEAERLTARVGGWHCPDVAGDC